MSSESLIDLLNSVFERRRIKNSKYSLRAFARDLGISPSALSLILSDKRKISSRQALQILDSLKVTDPDLHLKLVRSTLLSSQENANPTYSELDLERFSIIRDWYHFAILAAIDIDPAISEDDLAKKLDVKVDLIKESLKRLEAVGLLERIADGWRSREPRQTTAPTETPSADLRECHRQCIEKALESLQSDPLDVRHMTGTTMSFNPEKFELAKQAIMEFHRKILQLVDDGEATTVYRLNVQLFPLVKEPVK